jgi:hypothetical protein
MRDWTPSRSMRLRVAAFSLAISFKWSFLLVILIAAATFATAQTQASAPTPFLFAGEPVSFNPDSSIKQEGIVTLLRDPATGVVTLLPATAATFAHRCLPEVMEPKGQFLFGVCGNGLSMYTFDSTSGAVQETGTSPYAASTTDFPFLVAPESTGQFVYLLKFSNAQAGQPISYVLDTFQIDRTNSQLIAGSSQTLPFTCSTVAAVADPKWSRHCRLRDSDRSGDIAIHTFPLHHYFR